MLSEKVMPNTNNTQENPSKSLCCIIIPITFYLNFFLN
ncbi:Uncharacterised protein [Actinobacillus lignieresii]|uniref:Uncharacterized protein n=1 Tax=Actinobacillus lignieresii TaxID=720 RepID=A0A380U4Z0_ACTLI|nr:Uncharacterised protein [Actinobacillus lignieresii]VEB27599.1 Uncharacterised protein [Actinobacillus lignieresii]